MDRAQLEQLALEKMSQTQAVPSASVDRAELERLALEKMSASGMTEIDNESEADLGLINRAKYSIEPIQSNRKALLEQEYGSNNVMEKNGELYLKQDNKFVPLNKDGFSFSDVTDFAGATPEIVGGAVGTGVGLLAGVPSGGTMSVPLAIGAGAAGAGAGSAFRQGLSAIIGNPQVATVGERALETGISAAAGGAFSGAATYAKPFLSKAGASMSQIIKNLKGGGKEITEEVGETALKTVSNSSSEIAGQLTPNFEKQTADSVMSQVANQSERDMVKNEMTNLSDIAARENIPKPSYAQAAQGKALIAEAKILDMPLISGKVRKQYDGQLKAIKDNIEGITGKFIDIRSDAPEIGSAAREFAETIIESNKKASSELYQEVESEMAGAIVDKRSVYNTFRDFAGDWALVTPGSSEAEFIATKGLTRTEFKNMQEIVFDGLKALRANGADEIPFEALNGIKKTLKSSVEELKVSNPNSARILKKLVDKVEDKLEGTMRVNSPGTAEKLKAANSGWRKFYDDSDKLNSIIKNGNLDDEKVVRTVMSGTKNIQKMKDLIGEERVSEIGKSYVRDILEPLGKSGIARADSAMSAIKKQRAQIEAAIGRKNYDRLIDNLHFLNRTGQPLNVSRASLYNVLDNRGAGLKDLTLKLAGTAKTIAESKGTTISKSVKDKAVETTSKTISSASSQKNASSLGNILSDKSQRSWSNYPSYKGGNVTEQEAEKRKRAISGAKP